MSTPIYVCRRCAESPIDDCYDCRWLKVTADEAEERIEFLLRAATIARVPVKPSPLFWLLAERCPTQGQAAEAPAVAQGGPL